MRSTEKPNLYATLKNASENEVRHLLIEFVDGSRETKLVQLALPSSTTQGTEKWTGLRSM